MGCKRKMPFRSVAPPKKAKLDTATKQDKNVPSTESRFLSLPGEIRNAIYAQVCSDPDEKAHLHTRNYGNLSYKSGLLSVNHQVRDEFLTVLAMTVPTVIAHVKHLDFGHIITWFNRCEDVDFKGLATHNDAGEGQRKLVVCMHAPNTVIHCVDRLRRWVNRAARPEKRGVSLRVEYRVSAELCSAGFLHGVLLALADMKGESTAKAEVVKELSKVIEEAFFRRGYYR